MKSNRVVHSRPQASAYAGSLLLLLLATAFTACNGGGSTTSSQKFASTKAPLSPAPSNVAYPQQANICKNPDGSDEDVRICLPNLLNAGLAAGHVDDYYVNEDGDHEAVYMPNHQGLTKINDGRHGQPIPGNTLTDPEIQAVYNDPSKVKIGNASLVYNLYGEQASVPRFYGLTNQLTSLLYNTQFTQNWFNWHVEHDDHDDYDQLFFMTTMISNSQGSSGSELDEMDKFFYTLAAFPPATKALLKSSGTLVSTMQMLHRISRVATIAEYFTPLAHPSAFDNANNLYPMVRMANAMSVSEVPPMAKLRVISETFTAGYGQEVVTTNPATVARAWVGTDLTPRKIVVTLDDSFDPNGRPLNYRWDVVRGDPAKITIRQLNSAGSTVEITFAPHDWILVPIVGGGTIYSALAAVGAFVDNGIYVSAPAFVTSYGVPIVNRSF